MREPLVNTSLRSPIPLPSHPSQPPSITPPPPPPSFYDRTLLLSSIEQDLSFRIPLNYMLGAGDMYFSGKMLARLSRVLLVAEEFGVKEEKDGSHAYVSDDLFQAALQHLREGVEIWLNGSAISPLLYDKDWGGLSMCGCLYRAETSTCYNRSCFIDIAAYLYFE